MKKALFAVTLFALGLSSAMAQNITYTGSGTLKLISGSDPGGAGGKSGSIAITVLSTASPTAHTATTATYKLAAGAIVATFNGTQYSSTSAATMKITASKTVSSITIKGKFTIDSVTANITGVISLAKGSFTSAALKHPTAFSPASQPLASPKSYVSYSVPLLGTTKLGINGTASN